MRQIVAGISPAHSLSLTTGKEVITYKSGDDPVDTNRNLKEKKDRFQEVTGCFIFFLIEEQGGWLNE